MRINLDLKKNIPQILILILFFLGTMNCFNMYFYFLFAAFGIGILVTYRNVKVDFNVISLTVLSVLYIFLFFGYSSVTLVLKQFIYPLCYVLGLNFIRFERDEFRIKTYDNSKVELAIVLPALGPLFHFLLNFNANATSLLRNTIDYWTGEMVTATAQAGLAVLAIGVFAAWIFSTKGKGLKIASIIGLVLIFMYNLVLAGRTLLLITALVMLVAFGFSLKQSKINRKLTLFISTVAVISIALFMYTTNAFGIRDAILGSNFSARFDVISLGEDSRLQDKLMYLKNMIYYPFGGGALRSALDGIFAHDFYLDTYNEVGFLGFIVVVAFVAFVIINTIKLVKNPKHVVNLRMLILCVMLAIFIQFFLEPILIGMPWMFCVFCFYGGIIKSINAENASPLVLNEVTDRV